MEQPKNLDALDVLVRCRRGRYLASIPQAGLYATGDSVANAVEALEGKKRSLLEELTAADALDEIRIAPSAGAVQAGPLLNLALFTAKGLIIVLLVLFAVGYTKHTVQSEIEAIQAPRIGGAAFWADFEANIARAADPASDMPAQKKQALLADLHVIVNRWRPFVREVDRLFSDESQASAGNQTSGGNQTSSTNP